MIILDSDYIIWLKSIYLWSLEYWFKVKKASLHLDHRLLIDFESVINFARNFIGIVIGGKLALVNHNRQSLSISLNSFFCDSLFVFFLNPKTIKYFNLLFKLSQSFSLIILIIWKYNWSLGFNNHTFNLLLLLHRVHLCLFKHYFNASSFWHRC